jgi:hypothetical protein
MLSYGCSNPIFGCTRNPHDTDRTSGGSSGGEAALIASVTPTPLQPSPPRTTRSSFRILPPPSITPHANISLKDSAQHVFKELTSSDAFFPTGGFAAWDWDGCRGEREAAGCFLRSRWVQANLEQGDAHGDIPTQRADDGGSLMSWGHGEGCGGHRGMLESALLALLVEA